MILDASAVLAFLLREPGQDRVMAALLAEPLLTTVSFAEVVTRYVRRGAVAQGERLRDELPVVLVPVDVDLALGAAKMVPVTDPLGLSLADRLCLALAHRTGLPALTADRRWTDAAEALGVTVEIIR